MDRLPTLLILAYVQDLIKPTALQEFEFNQNCVAHALQKYLRIASEHNISIRLVANQSLATFGSRFLPSNWIVCLEKEFIDQDHDQLPQLISVGVANTANASGWIIQPIDAETKPEVIEKIAHRLNDQPVVYPVHKQQMGFPIGFSAEFFSELVQLRSDRDLSRLLMRYPALSIEIDAPESITSINCVGRKNSDQRTVATREINNATLN